MPYTKTLVLNEEQDMYMQEELQQLKAMVYCNEEDTGNVAQQILTILQAAPETGVS
jgi:hypothetical protein